MKKQAELNGDTWPPIFEPLVYYAQSTDQIFLKLRLHEDPDEPDCPHSFDSKVQILEDTVLFEAVCYESEVAVKLYKREVKLGRGINTESAKQSWDGESQLLLTLEKTDAPSYWPVIVEGKNALLWRQVHNKYIEQVEDYMPK